jgi:hypothetical protein
MAEIPRETTAERRPRTNGGPSHGAKSDSDSEYSACPSDSDRDDGPARHSTFIPDIAVVGYTPDYMSLVPSITLTAETPPSTETALVSSIFEPIPGQGVLPSLPLTGIGIGAGPVDTSDVIARG